MEIEFAPVRALEQIILKPGFDEVENAIAF